MMSTSQTPRLKLPEEFSTTGSANPIRVRDAKLRKHADYQRVYKATRKQFSTSMAWFAVDRTGAQATAQRAGVETRAFEGDVTSGPRVGLTAGKVLGKAHERNRIKRRLREIVRSHIEELPDGVDLILHPKRSVMTMEFVKLDAEVLRIFRQAATQVGKAAAGNSKRPASGTRDIS
jgi:ribonuclease P protein component